MAQAPEVKTRSMDRSPVVSFICCLTLLASGLAVSPVAHALATNPSPLIAGTEPLPDFSGVARTSGPEVAGNPAAAPATAPADSNAAATQQPDTGPTAQIPCLNSFTADEPDDGDSPDKTGPCESPSNTQERFSLRFGQRLGTTGGDILGEFDGVRVDYRLGGGLTLNGVAGYPVLSDKDKFNDTRQVLGISANTRKFARAWDLNSYLVEQQSNGKATSRTVGGALRYLRRKRSLLLFVDYDVAEHSLGAFTTSGAWKLPYSTTISATVDVRNNPIHKRQKSYLQRSMKATDGWSWILPSERIRYLTTRRSDEVTTLAFGLTHAFSRRLAMSGSVAMLDAADSADNASDPSSEYFYHLKLSGKDLLFAGDRNMLDLSHRVTDASRVSSAAIDTRYTINRRWNVSPRLRTDYRDNVLDRSVQWVTSPSVRMEYQWRQDYGFRIEAGGEWRTRELVDENSSESSYFVTLGYKAKF